MAGGRKPWAPSDKDRKEISAMIGMGLTARETAIVKGISHETLYKYCKNDIDAGRPKARARVMRTAFELAVSGRCPTMTIFWLKTQCGWKEPEANYGIEEEPPGFIVEPDA